MLSMIDESAYQASYWSAAALRINKIQVVAIKVTEGIGWFSSYYAWQLQQARLAGCAVLHYHLAHPETNTAASEVAYFASKATPEPGELIVLDAEPEFYGLIPASAASAWTGQWSADAKSTFGVLPAVYAAGSTIADGALESVRNKNPLWYAFPGANPNSPPVPPQPWLVSFLQYTTNSKWAPPNGTDVDVAYFNDFPQLAEVAIPPKTYTLTVRAKSPVTNLTGKGSSSFKVSRI